VRVVIGDFAAVAGDLDPADIVTMHRVVCCSPRFDSLLHEAASRCRRVFAFSYPRDRWYTRAWVRIDNLRRRVFRNPFRTFVHSPSAMEAILVASGFRRINRSQTTVWCVDAYSRSEDMVSSAQAPLDVVVTATHPCRSERNLLGAGLAGRLRRKPTRSQSRWAEVLNLAR
jgi:hypothetical protein